MLLVNQCLRGDDYGLIISPCGMSVWYVIFMRLTNIMKRFAENYALMSSTFVNESPPEHIFNFSPDWKL